MILFPFALIWLVIVFAWIVRNNLGNSDVPGPDGGPKRFRPRLPRSPRGGRSRLSRRVRSRSH